MTIFARNHTTYTLSDKIPIDNPGLYSTEKLKKKGST